MAPIYFNGIFGKLIFVARKPEYTKRFIIISEYFDLLIKCFVE